MAKVVIPGRGYSIGGLNTTATTAFRHLGPIGPGVVLDNLGVSMVVNGSTTAFLGAVLTATSDESSEAYASGAALIGLGGAVALGKPAYGATFGVAGTWEFVIPLGVAVRSGPRYVLCLLQSVVGGVVAMWNVWLNTLRVEEAEAVVGG